jgi:chaperonin GroES
MIVKLVDVQGQNQPESLNYINEQLGSANLAAKLPPEILARMGQTCMDEFKIDEESRSDWMERNEFYIQLATQTVEEKSEPFFGAANIKFPTLSMSAIQFAARAYPQLLQGSNIVKGKVIGGDPEGAKAARADRIGAHMSYQILERMPNWEDDTDGLLVALPIEGCQFKKTYFDAQAQVNTSIWVRPSELVINYHCKDFNKAQRMTHIIKLSPNEIVERVRAGVFLDLSALKGAPDMKDDTDTHDVRDEDAPHTFYEQHRWWDLDQDGYKEPYIVTIHRDSEQVVRIMPRYDADGVYINMETQQIQRIEPVMYFTRFLFMPSPDGGVYGMGFGTLLGPINTSINMTLNQIHDAGTLANTQGGFVGRSFQLGKTGQGGDLAFEMGEFKQVNFAGDDIRKAIMPLPFKGPDATLFNVLGMLVEAGEKLGSVTDPIMGEASGANTPATTTLALIEQGSKVFSAVFKRIHRSFKSEFRKLYRLNRLFLKDVDYVMVMDDPEAVGKADYAGEDFDVIPVSDPNMVSDTQMMLKAEVLKEYMGLGLNDQEIIRRSLEALRVKDIEKLFPKEEKQPEPDPKIVMEMMKVELEERKLDMAEYKLAFDIAKIQADTVQSLAKAEAAEAGPQIEIYKEQMKHLTEVMKAKHAASEKKKGEKSGGTKAK